MFCGNDLTVRIFPQTDEVAFQSDCAFHCVCARDYISFFFIIHSPAKYVNIYQRTHMNAFETRIGW